MQLSLICFLILRFYFTIWLVLSCYYVARGAIELVFWGNSIAMVSLHKVAV